MMHIIISIAVSILIGYLLGCSNMALYLSKLKGIDLREHGSRNLGTCNTYLCLGVGWSVLVFLHDAGKAALAVFLCRLLFPDAAQIGYVAGVAAVMGHMYPFYLHFHGGKGFASYLGMILMMDWRVGLIMLAAVAVLTLTTNYIVIATVAVMVSYPILTAVMTRSVFAVAVLCIASAAILYKHRENYVRIANGTEVGLFPKKPKP